MDIATFQELVWDMGRKLYRPMPWRDDTQPYYVLVSELMLQQTQVERVLPKFTAFIQQFPDTETLAASPLSSVLAAWSGLGYNRRAKYIHAAALMIETTYKGKFPESTKELEKLPGVGPNTAGALAAYSFNNPVVFIETNIRTVYFHHFFQNQETVTDQELRQLVAETVDTEHPRQWYWALMDYGSWLKRSGVRLNSKSHHYVKQTPLKGSIREVRGILLKELSLTARSLEYLEARFSGDERLPKALEGLYNDGLITYEGKVVRLST